MELSLSVKTNRRRHAGTAVFLAVIVFCLFPPLRAYADIISDVPCIGAEDGTAVSGAAIVPCDAVISDSPIILNVPEAQEESTAEASSAAGASETRPSVLADDAPSFSAKEKETDKAVLISESVPAGGGTLGVETAGTKQQETSASETAKPQKNADEASVAEAPTVSAGVSGGVRSITASPDIEGKKETTEAPKAISPAQARPTQQNAGASRAGEAVTRLYLDCSVVIPSHSNGSFGVARGSIRLSDGTWQKFSYSDKIRFPLFRLTGTATDSDKDQCYVVAVNARRFGDAYAEDGDLKTELCLKASDCQVKNYLDIRTSSAVRQNIVKTAVSLLGKAYVYGGNGPEAFDCSGFVRYVMGKAGITVPRTSTQLLSMDGQISASDLRPGDVMARNGHCGIYIGDGIFIHASDSSVGVVAEYLSVYNTVNKFTNCINVVGD